MERWEHWSSGVLEYCALSELRLAGEGVGGAFKGHRLTQG
jgi:hypothetical protein